MTAFDCFVVVVFGNDMVSPVVVFCMRVCVRVCVCVCVRACVRACVLCLCGFVLFCLFVIITGHQETTTCVSNSLKC